MPLHIALIEPQIGLTMFGVRAVAVEAVTRKDRADVLVEADLFRDGGGPKLKKAHPSGNRESFTSASSPTIAP